MSEISIKNSVKKKKFNLLNYPFPHCQPKADKRESLMFEIFGNDFSDDVASIWGDKFEEYMMQEYNDLIFLMSETKTYKVKESDVEKLLNKINIKKDYVIISDGTSIFTVRELECKVIEPHTFISDIEIVSIYKNKKINSNRRLFYILKKVDVPYFETFNDDVLLKIIAKSEFNEHQCDELQKEVCRRKTEVSQICFLLSINPYMNIAYNSNALVYSIEIIPDSCDFSDFVDDINII